MNSLAKAMKLLKHDKRLTDFFLKYNLLSKEEVQASLGQLEDSAANAEPLSLEPNAERESPSSLN